jgi:hypothetical protein
MASRRREVEIAAARLTGGQAFTDGKDCHFPITALILLTPAELASSLMILKLFKSAVLLV